MIGCVEASFTLAAESRLPKFVTIPPGLTRADVILTVNYCTLPRAKFILADKNGAKLAEVNGKIRNLEPLHLKNPPQGPVEGYPMYVIVVANGITEIMEHRRPEPILYVSDDPAIRKELLEQLPPK